MQQMSRRMRTPTETPLTDYKLAAAAAVLGGRLQSVVQDPRSGRLTFNFTDLPAHFVESAFNGEITVNLRDYLSALEHVQVLIAQYRARR